MNRLRDAASPYLRQHADDPVDWRPWGEEAFAEARERDVPVLVSIGYASCHWCHVMQHESFQDEATAETLNRDYVAIKVDREERPDVDAVYMAALQAMRGQGGWPLTAVTDGRGRPFFTGTYFPARDLPGAPSFRRVLSAVSAAWRERREALLGDAERLAAHVAEGMAAPLADAAPAAAPPDAVPGPLDLASGAAVPDPSAEALDALRAQFDREHGGFGGAPKFPPHTLLRWLLLRDERDALDMAARTLRAIVRGGIADPLAGGVARYAVDAAWRVPHFEKMLSDNVQLLPRLAEAHLRTRDPLFADAARSIVTWLEDEMRLPGGLFATALDADSENEQGASEEGAYYAWTAAEFDAAVGEEDAAFARAAYDVTEVGPFEGRNVLRAAASPADLAARFGGGEEEAATRLERVRERLLEARSKRPRPARDDKALGGLQGLAILGLARAGRLLGDARMVRLARETAEATTARMIDGERTWRRAHGETVGIRARLDDHAALGLGLLELHRADGEPRWLGLARAQARAVVEDFADPAGGFLSAPAEDDPLPLRPRVLLDAALPADTVAAAELVWRIGRLTGEEAAIRRALDAVAPLAEVARRHPQAAGSALALLDLMRAPAREAAVTGAAEHGADALWAELARRPLDAWAVQRGPAPAARASTDTMAAGEPPAWPLLDGRGEVEGRAAAWLCESYACRLPIVEPAELRDALP